MNVNYYDYYTQYYYTTANAMNTRQRIKENEIIFKAEHVNLSVIKLETTFREIILQNIYSVLVWLS